MINYLWIKGMKSFVDQNDFERSLDKYYGLRGWDKDGVPTKATIKKLELDSLVS